MKAVVFLIAAGFAAFLTVSPVHADPDNSLPCSSSLPDVNAAIRKELQSILGGSPLGGR